MAGHNTQGNAQRPHSGLFSPVERWEPLIERYAELVDQGKVVCIALDGIDGSGKGSCAQALAGQLKSSGYNVLKVEYPADDFPFGATIRKWLRERPPDIGVEEMMALFALNRIVTAYSIIQAALQLNKESQAPVVIIFDRYPTSNLITLAYELDRLQREMGSDHPEDFLQKKVADSHELMWQLDSVLAQWLCLANVPIYNLTLSSSEACRAIGEDTTRSGHDMYEENSVQVLADRLYGIYSTINPNLRRRSQYREEFVDGEPKASRRSASEQAELILAELDQEGILIWASKVPGTVTSISYDPGIQIPQEQIRQILEEYPRLSTRLYQDGVDTPYI